MSVSDLHSIIPPDPPGFLTDFEMGIAVERQRILSIIATTMFGSSPERRQLAHDLIRQIEGPA